jgi:hypothetical protein
MIFRHPPDNAWQLGEESRMIGAHGNVERHCEWILYYRAFQNRPTNADIESFKKEFRWTSETNDGRAIIEAKVCAKTWRRVIGEAPLGEPQPSDVQHMPNP